MNGKELFDLISKPDTKTVTVREQLVNLSKGLKSLSGRDDLPDDARLYLISGHYVLEDILAEEEL